MTGVRTGERDDALSALVSWRNGLVNLTGTNRAINFKYHKSSTVDIASPGGSAILEGLRDGRTWTFRGTSDDEPRLSPLPALTLQSSKPEKDLGAVLRNLHRRAKQEYLDRGLSVLYVALGMLKWQDVDDTPYASPLLLIPVDLVPLGPRDTPRLEIGEDDPTINPALTLRLQDFGIVLPQIDNVADLDLSQLLNQVRAAVANRSSWLVEETAVLSAFSFQKEAMYRDLIANEDVIVNHPVVRALANQDPTRQSENFLFEEITAERIDDEAPAESTPLVLDADSSQRACVAAAAVGRSFVMDGPPGTGKSQTIANMIGALLHAGKTVLFVSEKAAALEVVRNRLADAGLENYLLELYSHKASRKEVATRLAHALDNIPMPPPGMDQMSRKTVADHRRQLNAYARAMNRVRNPLGYSLHHVLGLIANLEHVPAAPIPDRAPTALSQEAVSAIREAAAQLARAWRPAEQGNSYLWREIIDRSSLDTRLYQAQKALEELDGLTRYNVAVAEAFDFTRPSQAPVMANLLAVGAARPEQVSDDWLTVIDLAAVERAAAELISALAEIRAAAGAVEQTAGVKWQVLPDPATLPPSPTLRGMKPPAVTLADLTSADARRIADRFASDAELLEQRMQSVSGLTSLLRLPPATTVHEMDNVLAVADAAYAPHRPLKSWLTPAGVAAARTAASTLRQRLAALSSAEEAAHRYFTDAALTQPLADLHERFSNVHKGLRKLFRDYRRDKKAVAAFTAEMVDLEDAIADLGLAVAWSQETANLAAAEAAHAAFLGSYWHQQRTDFAALDEALRCAEELIARVPESALPAVAEYVCASNPDPGLRRLIDDTRADLTRWRASLQAAAASAPPDLVLLDTRDAVAWLRAHLPALNDAARRAAAVSAATGRDLTLADSDALLVKRDAAVAAEDRLADRQDTFESHLGEAYQGQLTDETALTRALSWAKTARMITHGHDVAMTATQVKTLAAARQIDGLMGAYQRWQARAQDVIGAFDAARHPELQAELDDYTDAYSLLDELRQDSSGQDEWFAYQDAREALACHDLDAAINFCIDQAVPAGQIQQVLERALLRAWADHVVGVDGDLRPLRSTDRAALVQQYQDLDRQLIPAATAEIIRAVNARRPALIDVGEPAVIRREGMKKTRHIAVRELIKRSQNAALAITPCFMMSPLSVSQYLPADMRFDVVIFDEASQVTPGDAVNCIYRGNALITAGDDRQLPPTSFFDRMADAEEDIDTDVTDFQSILELAKASGAFRNLGLKWHYRSRHEALIAFSNHSFYEGKLVTYPSAHVDGPDVGVQMFHVPGTYRRGTSRDNLPEASKVVERVIHHFDTRPNTSLGVVTFSVAQADAVQAALDAALVERPDLHQHFDGDRLHGFFVKSLESVQGDERDVMIFSIGYGPDEHGKITSNFGALNKSKGWRRLNVAITRARQRVEIISSIRAGDIPASENESVRHLAAYLDYSERGMQALALAFGPSNHDADSPFEEAVIDAIRAMGYTVEPQVGAAGYRIDIGVRHPAHPGVFALGVECDGYMYHSSPAARDRDRLREQVLRGLGWNLHRIWGTAWYRNRQHEQDRLRAAIEHAISAPVHGRLTGLGDPIQRPPVYTSEVERAVTPPWVTRYKKATVTRLPRWSDPSEPGSRFDMVAGIQDIAKGEGPVHIDVVLQRARDAWNIGRVGSRIRDNIEAAVRNADVIRNGTFIDVPNRPVTSVREPGDGVTRTVEQVPDDELRLALTNLIADAGSAGREELMTATARIFGWNRRGSDITARLTQMINTLVTSGRLTDHGDALRLADNDGRSTRETGRD